MRLLCSPLLWTRVITVQPNPTKGSIYLIHCFSTHQSWTTAIGWGGGKKNICLAKLTHLHLDKCKCQCQTLNFNPLHSVGLLYSYIKNLFLLLFEGLDRNLLGSLMYFPYNNSSHWSQGILIWEENVLSACAIHWERSALGVTSRQSSNQMLDSGKVGGASEGNPDTQWLVADGEGGACRRKCLPTGPAVI